MIGILPGLPPNVAGFKATGDISREDYEKVVFPEVKKLAVSFRRLNFVFFVDTSLQHFSPGAWIRDFWLGLKDLTRWHKVAIISDKEKIQAFTDVVSPLFPGEYKGFPADRLTDAIRWASSEEQCLPGEETPPYLEVLLPPQEKGTSMQTARRVIAEKEEEARYLFTRASERLADVNAWTELCGSMASAFQLTDDRGEDLQGSATVGDFIRIDLPGPGTRAGGGYDWVRVEKIELPVVSGVDELFLLQLRPSPEPGKAGRGGGGDPAGSEKGEGVAHFLEDSATSTFIIEREGNTVTARVFGRNELPNTPIPGVVDKVRNAVVGAIALSKSQWKSLLEGVLEKE